MAVFHVTFLSQCLGRTVPMVVVLPTDKMNVPGTPKREWPKAYKTLYLLHGVAGGHLDWLYNSGIMRWAEERDLAVVMPGGDNYMYLDNPVDKYGEYVGRELVEFTRRCFPLSHKREDTFIGGLSMGGFGALRNGMKYHATFGAIVALSSALVLDESVLVVPENAMYPSDTMEYRQWVYGKDLEQSLASDRNPSHLVKELARAGEKFPAIYMACGDDDFLLSRNQAFHQLLEEYHVEHVYEQGPGSHDWDFWDPYMKKALDWLPLEYADTEENGGNMR